MKFEGRGGGGRIEIYSDQAEDHNVQQPRQPFENCPIKKYELNTFRLDMPTNDESLVISNDLCIDMLHANK